MAGDQRLLPALQLPRRPIIPIRRRSQPGYGDLRPTWRDARPHRIAAMLQHAQQRPTGGWYVVGESRELGRDQSLARTIAGREIALWRAADGSLRAGPGACPHLGALLDGCPVLDGSVVCRWHGLQLGDAGHGSWRTFPAHDDGALLWARPTTPPGTSPDTPWDVPTEAPVIIERPPLDESVVAVYVRRGRCEPEDVVANRLDPWHGAWFHPYSFSHLAVDDSASTDERLLVEVTFRLGRRFGVPVQAEFIAPDRRTVAMRIVEGEGAGSVVETHATPLTAPGSPEALTTLTEVTVAHSERGGFAIARGMAALLRPAMRAAMRRLWVDDLSYAERRYQLRRRGEFPG